MEILSHMNKLILLHHVYKLMLLGYMRSVESYAMAGLPSMAGMSSMYYTTLWT